MKNSSVYPCPTKKGHWEFDCLVSVRGVRRHLQSGYVYKSAREAGKALKTKKIALMTQREPSNREIFSVLAFRYYEQLREELKPTSYWQTYLFIERNLRKRYGDMSVGEVFLEENLHDFRESLYHTEKTEKTKNRVMQQFLAMAVFGYDHEVLADYELRRARVALKPFHGGDPIRKGRKAMTLEQYQKFIAAFRPDDKRKVLIQFLFATGCRIGEAAAVQINDYDPEKMSSSLIRLWLTKPKRAPLCCRLRRPRRVFAKCL
jgi:integrase